MITKIKIKNFGSIKDEQIIKFNKDVTAFIGKNESGKSTILKAIDKLNGNKILESEKNVLLRNSDSYIEGTFTIKKDEIIKINKLQNESTEYGFYCFPEEYDSIHYTKKVDDSSSTYYGLYANVKDKSTNKIKEKYLNTYFIDKIKTMIKSLLSDINNDSVKTFLKELDKLNEEEIKDKISSLTIEDEEIAENIETIKNEINKNHWIDLLPKYKFISFSSFKDVLSDNVLFSELDKNKQAENILKVANIDIEKLSKAFSEDDEVALDDMQTEYQEIVSEKFKEIFQQTDENFKLKIRFGTSKKDIIFLTQDKTSNTKSINLSQRSDGFKWYLSLYLTLYEYLEEIDVDSKNILLLDEPNLYLHPGAQKNLLYNVFYKEFSNVQVIYTTHSPYMIDIDNSFSIRIVEKKEQTKVYNSTREYALCNDKMKDVDTITPLLSALDLSISNDLLIDIKDKLFVVEGIQDVYTLKALIKKLDYEKKMKNIKFISGTSSEKVPYMYSYLYGMGYNVFTLVDNDKSGNKANTTLADGFEEEELYANLLTYDIINESKSEKFLLENLFSEQDLENFIPEKNTIYYKRLYDNYNTYDFSKETLNKFKSLFDKLIKIK